MEAIFAEIEKLSGALAEAKKNHAILEDRLNQIRTTLKSERGIGSKKELQEKIAENDKLLAELSKDVKEKFAAIQAKYQW